MNPVVLKCHPFVINLTKCTESSNVLYPKICVQKEANDIYAKAFNMVTNKNEAKAMTKRTSHDCKCKFNSTKRNSKQKWNNKICQCQCKNYRKCKNEYSRNPSTCICENSYYLKSIADTSVTKCHEIIIVMNIVSAKKTNTIATKKTIAIDITRTVQ